MRKSQYLDSGGSSIGIDFFLTLKLMTHHYCQSSAVIGDCTSEQLVHAVV